MEKLPFSPEIEPFVKPVEVGDTNKIYYDPDYPETLIRIPIDKEARFLEIDTKLIGVAEKIYCRLNEMGKSLDIDVASHQFILGKETSDGPVKPMLLAERIEGSHLVPIDKGNSKTLEALSRIARLGFKYLDWIESSRPKSVVTDIFRPDQYLSRSGEGHNHLTLVDIEARLKERDRGIKFINHELGMLVGPLRDSEFNDTFNKYMHHALRTLKQNQDHSEMASLINMVVNAPEVYQQMSDNLLAGREFIPSQATMERMRNNRLVIDKELLKRFGIEKI